MQRVRNVLTCGRPPEHNAPEWAQRGQRQNHESLRLRGDNFPTEGQPFSGRLRPRGPLSLSRRTIHTMMSTTCIRLAVLVARAEVARGGQPSAVSRDLATARTTLLQISTKRRALLKWKLPILIW